MALSPLGTLKNKTIFAAAWLGWSIMQVKILQDWGFTTKIAALDSLVSNGLLATFTIIIVNSLRYYRPKKGKYIVSVRFITDKQGYVADVKCEKDPGFGMCEHVLRYVKKSPKWGPVL